MRHASTILLFLSVLCASPALAGPRDDSLAGVSRCAALPDDRTFLDCVYGAMQPMRAQLGLQPAPPTQQRLVPPAYLPSRGAPPPSAQAAPFQPVPTQSESANNSGGIFTGMFAGNALHMLSYTFDKRGLFTVTLSDGSVWQQDANDSNFAHFSGKAPNYTVTLHQGDFGKSRMDVRGEGGPYLVERLR